MSAMQTTVFPIPTSSQSQPPADPGRIRFCGPSGSVSSGSVRALDSMASINASDCFWYGRNDSTRSPAYRWEITT